MAERKASSQEDSGKSQGNKKILLIIIAAIIIILIVAGVFTTLFFMKMKSTADQNASPAQSVPVPSLNTATAIGPMVDINEILSNIVKENDDSTHYVKASITLEVSSEITKEEVTKRIPQIRDSINLLISNKKYNELLDLHGKKQLKAELMTKINGILQSGSIQAIYFTDFVVQ